MDPMLFPKSIKPLCINLFTHLVHDDKENAG